MTDENGEIMKCQIPGCNNKSVKCSSRKGIFLGTYLENIKIWICDGHPEKAINSALQIAGELEAIKIQKTNPFAESSLFFYQNPQK